MCNKIVDDYAYVSGFAPICDKIQEMSNKNVNTYPAVIQFVPDRYKTQKMCQRYCYLSFCI